MKIRYRFNMIEVVLAIAILAIGLSSVMVLFTSGLRAQSGASEEILLSQLANEVAESIRVANQVGASAAGWNTTEPISGTTEQQEYSAYPTSTVSDTTGSTWVNDSGGSANRVYLRRVPESVNASGEVTKYVTDFSVMFNISKVTPSIALANTNRDTGSADQFLSTAVEQTKYSKTYLVKMSWPADISYKAREEKGNIRYFRVDVFNENFDVTDKTL